MKKESLWYPNNQNLKINPLEKITHTDILIIGGGMAGISTCYHLKDTTKKITLIEKNKIAAGISAHTTGKLTYLQDILYSNIEKAHSTQTALSYLQSQKEAIELVKKIIEKEKIDCCLEQVDSYLFTNEENYIKEIKQEETFLKQNHISYERAKKLPIAFPYLYGIKVKDTYVFHPTKYLASLAKICLSSHCQFKEQVCAKEIKKEKEKYKVTTNQGIIYADTVILANHYPFLLIPGFIPFKTSLETSYVAAKIVEKTYPFSAISLGSMQHSIRYLNDDKAYLIYASASHKSTTHLNREQNYQTLTENFHQFFHKQPDFVWQAHDLMPDDYLPYIGPLNQQNSNLYLMTGFQTWGMTNASLAGKIIADLILHKNNPYQNLFSIKRPFPIMRLKNLLINTYQVSKVYITLKLMKKNCYYNSDVKVVKEHGIRYGIYIDDKHKVHKVYNKCPHMGCNLIFNHFEKTWDCPCHASRYTLDGDIITGPTTKDIRIKKRSNS